MSVMRELFGTWGLALDDDQFQDAVGSRLVELAYDLPALASGEIAAVAGDSISLLAKGRSRWNSRTWEDIRRMWPDDQRSAEWRASTFSDVLGSAPVRIQVPDLERSRGADARFALAVIACVSGALHNGSVVAATKAGEEPGGWRWPLRVGVWPTASIDQLPSLQHRRYVRASSADTGGTDWDVLLVASTLAEALAFLAGLVTRVRARVVIVAGDERGIGPEALGASVAAVRVLVDARVCIVARTATLQSNARSVARSFDPWLRALIDEVGHNVPLDRAVFEASRTTQGSEPPLISGEVEFLDGTPSSVQLRKLGEKMTSVGAAIDGLPRPERLPGLFRMANGGGPSDAGTIGAHLLEHADAAAWDRESDAATGTALLADAVREALAPVAEKAEARFLHAGAREIDGHLPSETYVPHLLAACSYSLDVWVGPDLGEGIALSVAFPELPDPSETHELQVVLNEPSLLGAPQIGKLRLPPTGVSGKCTFVLRIPPETERVAARIALLHRGRVLQTGILSGIVVGAGATPGPEHGLRFTVDAAPRRRLQTLGGRSRFDAAFVSNHDEAGEAQTLGVVGDRVARIKISDATLKELTDLFNATISDIAAEPDDYKTLRSSGTVSLLRNLAQHGAMLHRAIEKHSLVGPGLAQAKRVQIVTARLDGFLPLELAYLHEAPEDDAKLCKGAEKALESGKCPKSCAGASMDKLICPLGFWGLSKAIERFAHKPAHLHETSDFSLFAEPVAGRTGLARPTAALVAASAKATAHDSKAVTRVTQALKVHTKVEVAKDWVGWTRGLGGPPTKRPELLVLLPHHVSAAGDSVLELGKESSLKATLVKPKHVVGAPKPNPTARPIVLLLGCETQESALALERFPSAFADNGAVMIIATIATDRKSVV